MKKPDLSKFCIKSTKDWVIFWIFAALLVYALADGYDTGIVYWLRSIETPWLGYVNEPQNYGRMMISAAVLAVLAEAVCFLRRKSLRIKLAVLAAGVLVPTALVGMYLVHCRLIVSSLWQEEPGRVTIWWKESSEGNTVSAVLYTPDEEEQEKLLEYCRKLTVVSDEALQEEFIQWYREADTSLFSQNHIDLHYAERYGHSYSLDLYVWDDYLYFFRGHKRGNGYFLAFFEDNGLIQYLEDLRQEQVGAAE